MSGQLLAILTLATVLGVGNLYLCQPLLGRIAADFHRGPAQVGLVPMLTQLGYVGGLLLVAPLGDMLEKRRLVVCLLVLSAIALLGSAAAPSFELLAVSSLAVGLTSVLIQILIPFVAVLSSPAERGKNLGIILSGALIGILISRTLSGYIGAHLGWRGVFYTSCVVMLALAAVLAIVLPPHRAAEPPSYPRLLKSLWSLLRGVPGLRAVSVNGALMYAALSGFWATLAFYLQSPPHLSGPEVAGSFGLVGAVGALSANLAGRHAERIGPRRLVQACIGIMIFSFLVMAFAGSHMVGLVVGVVLLDLGAQAASVSNQTQLYTLHPEAQSRLNTIYKIFFYSGGALGSMIAASAWQLGGWNGVCGAGVVFLAVAWLWERIAPVSA